MRVFYSLTLVLLASALLQTTECADDEYAGKYQGHAVYKVYPTSSEHIRLLKDMQIKLAGKIDFWTELRNVEANKLNWVDIMLEQSVQKQFEILLNKINVKYEIKIPDVARAITEQLLLNTKQNTSEKLGDFDYGSYHQLDDINHWMNDIEAAYPKYVTVFNITRSYQHRDIFGMKISIPNASKKPALWFDGGIHAREWISPATVIYIAYSLLSKFNVDPDTTKILNTFDFYILPVFNVDGYEYTWSKDRMWRKTRSKTDVPTCIGVDPNRNWDTHFCDDGASKDPCSDTYCGKKPFSEPETQGVANFLALHNDTIVSYINFHSYSQLWMSPWGYSTDKPPKFNLQDGGSAAAVGALAKLYGTQYEHGTIADTIYIASGSSVDWTYDALGIVYSYGVELRDQGQYGFLLPPDQIIPSGLETFEAVKALALYIKNQQQL